MTNVTTLKNQFLNNEHDSTLTDLYYDDLEMIKYQKERYVNALDKYIELFGEENVDIYSAPGRTEVGGNHTDHQHGMVLAASVNLDAIAIVGNNDKNTIELFSEGYSPLSISLDNIAVNEAEFGTTSALIKGVIAGMNDHGYKTGPFKAYVTSDVLNGAGLSSSAAFEAIIGTILSGLYNDMKVSPIDIAIIGQYAENVFFGKPCGLMDQMACSVGGFVHIDFKDPANPIVEKVDFDIADKGYSLCIVDTKGSHADLTDDYSAIPKEMKEHIRKRKIMAVTLTGSLANFLLLVFKFVAGVLGHSSAMIADAVHSLSDFVTDVIVLLFINISSKPKDEGHDYGHGKYETLATTIIGIVLMCVGAGLFWDGANKVFGFYFGGEQLESPGKIALIAAIISILIKETLYRLTLYVGKKENSQAVIANAWHHRSDAFSSIGTTLGIGGAILLGDNWRVLDPIAAVIVSILIVKVAFQLVIPAINDLLEKSLPTEVEDKILSIINETPEVRNPHNLCTRRIGNDFAIEVHIRVDGQITVSRAHELTKEIESKLRLKFGPATHIVLHVEPIKEKKDE